MHRRKMGGSKVSFEMHSHNAVKLLLFHRETHAITNEPSVIDQNIQITEFINRALH